MHLSLGPHINKFENGSLTKLFNFRTPKLTVDIYRECIEDLFRIAHPYIPVGTEIFDKSFARYSKYMLSRSSYEKNACILRFPWRNDCSYIIPNQILYHSLRTSRNRYLISEEEQAIFRASTVGIAGLSVGSNILNSLVLSGGPARYSLADGDTLSLTNMNRIYDSLVNIGRSKLVNVMQKNLELDPYISFNYEQNYLSRQGFDKFFFIDGAKLSLFFEEMDDISLKIHSRFFARKHHIPVVMLTDNGDNVIVDVERFDIEPKRKILHGLIDEDEYRNIPTKLSQAEKVKLANSIVGPDVVPAMRDSLQMVGTRLPTWPQLGTAAILSGVVGSYIARSILAGRKINSGRYRIDLDSILDGDHHLEDSVIAREDHKARFIKSMEIIFGKL